MKVSKQNAAAFTVAMTFSSLTVFAIVERFLNLLNIPDYKAWSVFFGVIFLILSAITWTFFNYQTEKYESR